MTAPTALHTPMCSMSPPVLRADAGRLRRCRRGGLVLYAVMVIVAMASLVAAGLMFRVQAETAAADAGMTGRQAYLAARSGIQRAAMLLAQMQGDLAAAGLTDDEALFRNQLVWDDGTIQWYFTIYAENLQDPDNVRYGITDEAGKFNLNWADHATLLAMPNMTEELADSLLDYIDEDDDTRAGGAEQDWYDRLAYPYYIKNGPIATLEELLLVKGFNALIVFGEDANRNGLLDPNEDDGDESFPPDDADGVLNAGLSRVATAFTTEKSSGSQLNLNGDLQSLRNAAWLTAGTIDYIEQEGPFRHPSDLLYDPSPATGGPPSGTPDITRAEIAMLLEGYVAGPQNPYAGIGGLNIMTASIERIAMIGGFGMVWAQDVVSERANLTDDEKKTPAWLLLKNLVNTTEFKGFGGMLSTQSNQYRIRCIGFGYPIGRFCILEVIIDLSGGKPRVMYMRDLTRLGQPFVLDVESEQL